MNLLATGHMLADVVAIMGKCFLRPHYIFPLVSRLFPGHSPTFGRKSMDSFIRHTQVRN